jgi:hypothetical protein
VKETVAAIFWGIGVTDKVVKVSVQLLRDMLLEAYQGGWYGLLELGEESADGIIERRITEDMVVYPPEQLRTVNHIQSSSFLPFIGGGIGGFTLQTTQPVNDSIIITANDNIVSSGM